jgi:1-acyl-sn-glycerol-3-phosphate acyltransferase
MRILKPFWRSLRLCEHLLTGATVALLVGFGHRLGLRTRRLPDLVRWWHGRLCRALGIRIETIGDLAPNALLVANHVSWLDISVIGAQGRIGFVSKAEVREWPLIGWMAGIAGTLFMTRGANQTGEVIHRVDERLRTGVAMVVFPEGTTTDGARLLRFHPRLLAAGQGAGIRVQPVAVRFGTNGAPDPIAPFVGDDALLPHLARLVRHTGLRVRLHFLPPLEGRELSRGEISEYCRSAIAAALDMETALPPPCQIDPAGKALPSSAVAFVQAT